jgi:hypothetical protein
MEAILTSLIFDHALRIRLKAETDTNHSQPATTLLSTTTASTSVTTSPASAQVESTNDKKARRATEPKKKEAKKKNLVGKINNLMTSDLANINRGVDILFLGALFACFADWFRF